jgi:hypothetical protein
MGLDGEAGVTILVEWFRVMADFRGWEAIRRPSADCDSSFISDVSDNEDVSAQSVFNVHI